MDATEPLPPPLLLALVYFFTLTPIVALLAHTHLHHWQVLTVCGDGRTPELARGQEELVEEGVELAQGLGLSLIACCSLASNNDWVQRDRA